MHPAWKMEHHDLIPPPPRIRYSGSVQFPSKSARRGVENIRRLLATLLRESGPEVFPTLCCPKRFAANRNS